LNATTPALHIDKVVKRYSNHVALNEVGFDVLPQRIFGLLGPNGAGKTTLIRIINQIGVSDSGTVKIFGEDLKPEHIGLIGYLPEERGLYKKMKVGEQALYLAQLKGLSKKEAKKNLDEWFERFEITEWWNKKVEELSKGMAQKVQFITTVLHKPKLIILDEPFSGFDPVNANLIKSEILRLRDEGATIILSTHNMNSVEEICDDIALINHSKVVLSGNVKDIRKQFSKNSYQLEFEGNMIAFANSFWGGFEILEKKSDNEKEHSAVVKLSEGVRLNDFLMGVLPSVQLKWIKEVIPSMNDIFIEAVNQKSDNHE
jgi:ABC-2 type transport system ATP-binding protein